LKADEKISRITLVSTGPCGKTGQKLEGAAGDSKSRMPDFYQSLSLKVGKDLSV